MSIVQRNEKRGDRIGLAHDFSGWLGLITAVVAIVVLVIGFAFHWDALSSYGVAKGGAAACGVIYLLWHCTVTYQVNFSGVTMRRFGIPVRFVSWEKISQIGRAQLGNGECLIITQIGCEKFEYRRGNPKSYLAERYLRKHRAKTLCIENVKTGVPIIEKYYGPLDYDYTRN